MSATPETDALYKRLLAENPGNFIHLEEFLELACRLERERDEALMDRASGDIATMTRNHYERLIKERDEARKHLRAANRGAEINAHINQKFAQQIIDAREQFKELIYIAERAIALAEIDFENDKFGVVSELRDGVERIKEGAK
jgi:hypothetical protein